MRVLLFFIGLTLFGQSKPNFSGTWQLNKAASNFGDPRAVGPDKLVCTIQQKGDHFKYKFEREKDGKKTVYDWDVTVGGPPYESNAAGIVTLEWKVDSLVVSTLYNPGTERQSDQVQTLTLSQDGKRLTDDVVANPPGKQPAVHIVRVFDRQ
jgi:hypothetical protein